VALQERFGNINDLSVAPSLYARWLRDADEEPRKGLLRELIDEEEVAVNRLHDQFLQDWTPDRAGSLRQRVLQELNPEHEPRAAAVG
jgi:hypothetical protein